MKPRTVSLALGILALAIAPAPSAAQTAITTSDMEAFRPRVIGPAVTGGRVHDIEAIPDDPSTLYVASASGGLWKSTNRGHTWINVFDTMAVSTFGDVALAPSDPDIVYAGTGEQNNRQSTSWGNGVYRSDDAGMSWRHLGLTETRHIGKVEISPEDPDVAYVAALGSLWAPSEDRGVYRTRDGGGSWERVLFIDEHTGVVDMVMHPTNPDVLYAATYQRLRRTWGFNGGGPGSGIHMTRDGGENWVELTNGLPDGDMGRIGLAISASNPQVLNAIVQSDDSDLTGVYRTEDGGMSWERVNSQNIRPMYYSEIFIDPTNEDRVYTLATSSFRSEDGGRTFVPFAQRVTYDVGVHSDHHALWIDPSDPEHIYMGGDSGLHETYDMGLLFRKLNNFPIAQFYAIGVDMRDPYWVYGGLQDNHSFFGPSETRRWAGILNDDWMQNGFGDGMYWQADPRDARFTYGTSNGGSYHRYDAYTGDHLDISPEAGIGEEEYRFDWTSPLAISKHDPDVLYALGNRLFISRDRGESWWRTEDLTRQIDRDELELMGVKGRDIAISRNDGTGSFGEGVTLSESPLTPDVFWVGFDDGNLQVSRDGGRSWTEVSGNVPGIADGTYVSRVAASMSAPGTAYATFDAHRRGDFAPYVFRTEDFGATWTPLHAGLDEMGSVNVIVEHPDNTEVLFLGTEHAMFASTDAGANWAKMPNLPTTAYDDVLIHPREKDLVLGTHGRSIWVLDDTRPFTEFAASTGPVAVYSTGPARLKLYKKDTSYRGDAEFAGENPVDGAIITYRIADGSGDATMTVTAPSGRTVREMTVPGDAGVHRVNWDLRNALPGRPDVWSRFEHDRLARSTETRGPWVSPGLYTVTVAAGDATASTTVEVQGDPDMPITLAEYQARERFMMDALWTMSEMQRVMREAGVGGGGGGFGRQAGPPDTPEALMRAAARRVGQIYGSLNGSGIRAGSLYPPTQAMRDAVNQAARIFEEARRELGG